MVHSLFAKVFFLGLLVVVVTPLWAQQQDQPVSVLTGKVPAARLYFEPNEGQLAAEVLYLARAPGYQFFLTAREAVWRLHERWPDTAKLHPDVVIRLQLAPAARIEPRRRLAQISHYYIGNDPRRWRRSVPAYERVLYQAIYPGIDLVFYGQGSQLEYDFRVAPGADPAAIGLGFSGVDQLRVDEDGNLVLHQGETRLVHHRPLAYQEVDGQKKYVAAAYQVVQGKVSFRIAEYDHSLPLIIDPTVTFSSYLGGSGDDEAFGVAVDGAGNIYVTGRTASADFPSAPSSGLTGYADAFVSKFNPDGDLLFTAYLGGDDNFTAGGDIGRDVVVDTAGNIYITGDADFAFPVTTNAFDISWNGTRTDAFVAVLDATSGALTYSTYLGGANGADEGHSLAVDSGGDIYVTGVTKSSDFPVKNAFSSIFGKLQDAFLVKLRPGNNGVADLLYASYFGGPGADAGLTLALQGPDQVYVGGASNSSGLAKGSVYQSNWVGNDGFIAHFNTSLAGAASLLAATYLNGTVQGPAVSVNGLALDSGNDVYVTGTTQTATFPFTDDALDKQFGGNSEAFVAILSADLRQLFYASFLGGSGEERGVAIAVDSGKQIHVTGSTSSAEFPEDTREFPYGGGKEAFLFVLDSSRSFGYALYLGGSGDDVGRDVTIDATGNAYVAGATRSVDFLPTTTTFDALQGGQDAFLIRITNDSGGTGAGAGSGGGAGGGITITDGSGGSSSSGSGGGGGGMLYSLICLLILRLGAPFFRDNCLIF